MKRFTLILLASTALAAAQPGAISRKATAFDISAPLSVMEQFISDKRVAIHPAEVSKPEHQGSIKGPGTALGSTPPNLPPERPGRGGRGGRAPSNAPAAPIIPPLASFDGLGEGFTGITGVPSAGRGGIDISLAVGPDHIGRIPFLPQPRVQPALHRRTLQHRQRHPTDRETSARRTAAS